jgi:hypothetical protein
MPIPYLAPTYFTPLYFPAGYFGGLEPPPSLIFNSEFAWWLGQQLGVGVYPLKIPQRRTDYPYLTYTIVDGDSALKSSGPAGLAWRHYQLDAFSTSYPDAETLAEQLRNVLQGYAGAAGNAIIVNANLHRPATEYDNTPDSSDAGVYRFCSEYMIWYREPLPVR